MPQFCASLKVLHREDLEFHPLLFRAVGQKGTRHGLSCYRTVEVDDLYVVVA
jgi:hypothetical protein